MNIHFEELIETINVVNDVSGTLTVDRPVEDSVKSIVYCYDQRVVYDTPRDYIPPNFNYTPPQILIDNYVMQIAEYLDDSGALVVKGVRYTRPRKIVKQLILMGHNFTHRSIVDKAIELKKKSAKI